MSRSGLTTALIVGVALRLVLIVAAPRYGYHWDHYDNIGMGIIASELGLLHIYSATEDALPTLHGWVVRDDGTSILIDRRCINLPNYPPLTGTLFWLQSWWLGAREPGFVANTAYTRFVTAIVPTLFELATAIGVALVVRALSADPRLAAGAGVVTWLAPPLMMNTTLWSQVDALMLAPAVFALLAMVRGRWWWTGVCLGLGLLLKPQGMFMLPVAGFAVLVAAPHGSAAFVRRSALVAAGTCVTLAVVALPWMVADGLAWLQRCYLYNVTALLPFTTLEAHNVWYLVALVAERRPVFDVLDSRATLAGLTLDFWGRALLSIALVATAALTWWRRRDRPALAIALFAALALWSTFIWPTRVHERFLVYPLPFVIIAAAVMPRLRAVAAIVVVLAVMEHSWMLWRSGPPAGRFDRTMVERVHAERFKAYWKDRPVTVESAKAGPKPEESTEAAFVRYHQSRAVVVDWLLTVCSLAAYVAGVVIVARPTRVAPSSDDAADRPVIRSA